MTEGNRGPLDELTHHNLRMMLQLEHAEAFVPALNAQIDALARLRWLAPTALVTGAIAYRPYASTSGMENSCQVLRAGLLIPGGAGILVLDLQDHHGWNERPDVAFRDAERCFLPFDDCSPSERAVLFPHVPALLRSLNQLVLPTSRSMGVAGG